MMPTPYGTLQAKIAYTLLQNKGMCFGVSMPKGERVCVVYPCAKCFIDYCYMEGYSRCTHDFRYKSALKWAEDHPELIVELAL